MSDDKKKAYKYEGGLTGAYPGLGYVEPGKVIVVETADQEDIIKRAPKGTFSVFDGKVTKANTSTFPVEAILDPEYTAQLYAEEQKAAKKAGTAPAPTADKADTTAPSTSTTAGGSQ